MLDLSFNNIKHIEGLETLAQLEDLYLVSNRIKKVRAADQIERLAPKPRAKMIELSANKIEKIENLEGFPALAQLYLNKNRIAKIENLFHVRHIQLLGLSVAAADGRRTRSRKSRTCKT